MAEKATAVQKAAAPATTWLKLVEPETLLERISNRQESIARHAFELFEARGALFGRDLDDWFRAETELFHPVHLQITETDDTLAVYAEVPGFEAKELKVSVEPRRITINGKRGSTEEGKTAKTLYKGTVLKRNPSSRRFASTNRGSEGNGDTEGWRSRTQDTEDRAGEKHTNRSKRG
jgi:HSP20 family molecular chaperone IbpA